MKVLIATSTLDFDPSEVAIPWKVLNDAGIRVIFATDTGTVGAADPRMLSGAGFGILKPVLIARRDARDAYDKMQNNPDFLNPIGYDDIRVGDFAGLVLPGGHAKGVRPYLESKTLQTAIVGFFAANKPIGAICHGVVAACRTINPKTGKSVLHGRRTTALLNRQELLAYKLTKRKMGDYYLTYPVTVEVEVTKTLRAPTDFVQGPTPLLRDSPRHMSRGFTLRDGNYLSARWPGDVYSFSTEFLKMLAKET